MELERLLRRLRRGDKEPEVPAVVDDKPAGAVPKLRGLVARVLDQQRLEGRSPHILLATDRADSPPLLPGDAQVLTLPCDPADLQFFLATSTPWDVVVLDVADAELRRTMFLRLAFAPRTGGAMVVAKVGKRVQSAHQSVLRLVADTVHHGEDEPPPKGIKRRALPHLKTAWRRVELCGPHLVVGNDTDSRVILGEAGVDRVLDAQPHRGRVLTNRPGGILVPRGEKRESESPLADSWRREYDVPTVSLREYDDVVAVPGQVLLQDRVILPDSFRHVARAAPGNSYSPHLGPSFMHGLDTEPTRVLEEPHFYWDSEYRGHFGHLMTEMLSRMWAFDAARERHPGLKVFMAKNKHRGLAGFEVTVLEAFGGTREDITFVDEPVRVNTMLAATPMFSQPEYVHPEIVGVWDRLSAHLAAQAPDRERPRRLFVGRKTGKRACTNKEEVEARFVERGFEIVFPEEHPLPEQARLFREAEVLAGYTGSGLFNALLAEEPKHLILIASESYTAENEWMIAAARGHRVDVAWSKAQIPGKKGTFNKRAFHSPYTFDAGREGVFLDGVLDELG